jgi:SAM-dependent methyltransferase
LRLKLAKTKKDIKSSSPKFNHTNFVEYQMAHLQQVRFLNFIKQTLPEYFNKKKVLEVGSLDINGSVRSLFVDCDYTGIDVADGNGVDLVVNGEDFSAPANSMDVVISCECFEHNPEYEKTWLNMVRVLKRDGLLIMTCATLGRGQHGTSSSSPESSPLTVAKGQDYYKNLVHNDFDFLKANHFFAEYFFVTDYSNSDLYFVGLGGGADSESIVQLTKAKEFAINFYNELSRAGLR